MYDICHPTYYNMSQLGCSDQIKLTTAFYVYMELCEVKRYWDVEYKYSEKLELFYLQAKKRKSGSIEIFIPWPAIHNLTLDLISNIQEELETEKFTFVFKEGDTTSVYYCVSSGMIKPINPDDTKILKRTVHKKVELDKEIQRNAANLYERALFLDSDENDVRKNVNSLDDEIDDKQMTEQMNEELELEDIEIGQSEMRTLPKSDLTESEYLDTERFESKSENLETERFESKSENLETERFESKTDKNSETDNFESERDEKLETENFESERDENLEIENVESKTDENLETENSEIASENLESETTENNINNNN